MQGPNVEVTRRCSLNEKHGRTHQLPLKLHEQNSLQKMDSNVDPEKEPLISKQGEKNTTKWTVFLAVITANMFTMITGMVEGFTAPATVDMRREGSRFLKITSDQITWIPSLPIIASGVGCFASGYTSQAFGRRASLMLISPLYVMSWLIVAYAPSLGWVYSGRFISGFCFGLGSVSIPAYVTEVAPNKIRGLLGTVHHFTNALGVLLINLLAYELRWSWMAVSGATACLLAAFLMLFMPESPEWLLKNSRRKEAMESLQFFHRGDVQRQLRELEKNLVEPNKKLFDWKLFLDPTIYKPLAISFCMVLFAKWSGTTVITAYSVVIFKSVGSAVDPQSSAVLLSVVTLLSTLVTSLLVDKAGRRALYITSASVLTVSLVCVGLYDYLHQSGYDLSDWKWIPMISFFVHRAFYSSGIGLMVTIMTPEMVPIGSRSTVIAIVMMWSSLLAFSTTKLFGIMVENLGFCGLFWTYGAATFLATLFGIFILPETKGRAISEINNSFR